ncbi:SMC-Scp complex subunit ScpB [Roseomonas indoligenes]|uniref:SMC-Scp complex subunit ScpB n=1 Tax=Roseomonas indoligenes TaxID=2820811 RepID=A0A940MXW6_9PROT|nr:SMC-Scp complex subunit ScpB [Pararoseomonas indoligenes]
MPPDPDAPETGPVQADTTPDGPTEADPDDAPAVTVDSHDGHYAGILSADSGEEPPPLEPVVTEGPSPVPAEAIRLAEAMVFASATPVTAARLSPLLPSGVGAAETLAALAAAYEGRGVTLVNVAGGFAFRTAEDLAPLLTRVVEVPRRLPRVAMEALAIIAWHQPVTRGEIEEIRGTALSQTTLEILLENALIAPRGKKEAPGRPTLWGTTPKFLEQFGLTSLRDLPKREELMPDPGLPLPAPDALHAPVGEAEDVPEDTPDETPAEPSAS